MDIVELYKRNFWGQSSFESDYRLVMFKPNCFIGVDKNGLTSVVVNSAAPNEHGVAQRSKLLNIECNVTVSYLLDNTRTEGVVHVLRCLSTDSQTRILFLELATLFLGQEELTATHLLAIYHALAEFFSEGKAYSDNELTGLYGELYTIVSLEPDYPFGSYWQSTDRMKYDFSVSEQLKVEVKTTQKNNRIHHFGHEQLVSPNCNIYVLSYMLRPDDEGLSLFELIASCKEIVKNDFKKTLKLDRVIKDVEEERLKDFRFNEQYTKQQCFIYEVAEIPHFSESAPEGVINAEYDVDLTRADTIPTNVFLAAISGATA